MFDKEIAKRYLKKGLTPNETKAFERALIADMKKFRLLANVARSLRKERLKEKETAFLRRLRNRAV
jgi:hypothetical protein